jgi:hypothetical protein
MSALPRQAGSLPSRPLSYQRPLNPTLRPRLPSCRYPGQARAQAPVGIHVFCRCKQRHGWRAFAHHDVGRPVSDGSIFSAVDIRQR